MKKFVFVGLESKQIFKSFFCFYHYPHNRIIVQIKESKKQHGNIRRKRLRKIDLESKPMAMHNKKKPDDVRRKF